MPMMGIVTRPQDAVAVPLGGLASAAREVCGSFDYPLSTGPSLAPVPMMPHVLMWLCSSLTQGSVAACDSGHWGPDCIHPCNCSAGHGSCDAVSGLCLCEAGYEGPRCEKCEYQPGAWTSSFSVHIGTHIHITTHTHAHRERLDQL